VFGHRRIGEGRRTRDAARRRRGAGLVALAGIGLSACGGQADPALHLCEQILARKRPEARIAEARVRGHQTGITYRVETPEGGTDRGWIACDFQVADSGGLRLRSALLDGQALTDAELAVINSELFLGDLRRADPAGGGRRAARADR